MVKIVNRYCCGGALGKAAVDLIDEGGQTRWIPALVIVERSYRRRIEVILDNLPAGSLDEPMPDCRPIGEFGLDALRDSGAVVADRRNVRQIARTGRQECHVRLERIHSGTRVEDFLPERTER